MKRTHVPFLRLIDDVTDLHVQRPVLALQGAICCLFCKVKKQNWFTFLLEQRGPGKKQEVTRTTTFSYLADGLSQQRSSGGAAFTREHPARDLGLKINVITWSVLHLPNSRLKGS